MLGSVTASHGDVVLIAAMVDSQGHIAAPNGQAILGSGGEVVYVPDGRATLSAQQGKTGKLLVDPTNVDICVACSGTDITPAALDNTGNAATGFYPPWTSLD